MKKSHSLIALTALGFFACGEDSTAPNTPLSSSGTSSVLNSNSSSTTSSSSFLTNLLSSSIEISSSSNINPLNSSTIPLSSSSSQIAIATGSLVDSRDGQVYKTVKIGTQNWMAENLNYAVPNKEGSGSWCYDNKTENCDQYGRLYDWYTIMASAKSSNLIPSGVQGICPSGWHLPSDQEWEILATKVGADHNLTEKKGSIKINGVEEGWHWTQIGNYLKAKSTLWTTDQGINALDSYGFSAIPTGAYYSKQFLAIGSQTMFWSATENSSITARFRSLDSDTSFSNSALAKENGFSVRCIQN